MKKRTLFFLLIISILTIALYTFRLKQSLFYHPDFARDMHEILKISQGDIVLLGPKLTFGGLYLGPYYFYLFVPAYLLAGREIISIHYFNMLLFILALGYFFKKASAKYGLIKSLFGTITIALLPLYLIGSRNPSNAYSYIPLFFLLLVYLYFNREERPSLLFTLGFIFGIITNFHYLNIVFLPALMIYFSSYLKDKRKLLLFLFGLGLSFLPLLLFEIKHNFIMFTNTFIDKSYLKWVNKENLPVGFEAKKNVIANIIFLSSQMKQYLIINSLILYLITGALLIFNQLKRAERLIWLISLLTMFLTALIIRFQFIPHYLFGLSFFLFFNFLVVLMSLNKKIIYLPVLTVIILSEILFFPKHLYQPSWRTPDRFEKAADFVINNRLINKNDSFNLIQITRENLLATLGFEYRYFLRKKVFITKSEFEYSQSDKLIIFSELPKLDISQFRSWEVDQFGNNFLKKAKRYPIDQDLVIYLVNRH